MMISYLPFCIALFITSAWASVDFCKFSHIPPALSSQKHHPHAANSYTVMINQTDLYYAKDCEVPSGIELNINAIYLPRKQNVDEYGNSNDILKVKSHHHPNHPQGAHHNHNKKRMQSKDDGAATVSITGGVVGHDSGLFLWLPQDEEDVIEGLVPIALTVEGVVFKKNAFIYSVGNYLPALSVLTIRKNTFEKMDSKVAILFSTLVLLPGAELNIVMNTIVTRNFGGIELNAFYVLRDGSSMHVDQNTIAQEIAPSGYAYKASLWLTALRLEGRSVCTISNNTISGDTWAKLTVGSDITAGGESRFEITSNSLSSRSPGGAQIEFGSRGYYYKPDFAARYALTVDDSAVMSLSNNVLKSDPKNSNNNNNNNNPHSENDEAFIRFWYNITVKAAGTLLINGNKVAEVPAASTPLLIMTTGYNMSRSEHTTVRVCKDFVNGKEVTALDPNVVSERFAAAFPGSADPSVCV